MWLCPVLSLLRFLFCYPDLLKCDVPIFEGKLQCTRYATQLTKLFKQLDMHLKIIGFEVGYLGSHSCSKGVAKMVATVCIVYHPIFALCIWAVWVLGEVKDK